LGLYAIDASVNYGVLLCAAHYLTLGQMMEDAPSVLLVSILDLDLTTGFESASLPTYTVGASQTR
jgi:hypothetical protein